jgi:hypothetical protein
MATLEIDLDATMIVQMVRALNTFSLERSDMLAEILYEHGDTLAEVAAGVDGIRALDRAAADRDLTEAEDAALHKARTNGGAWMRKKAGQILTTLESPLRDDLAVCDASTVDDHVERFAACPRNIACTPDGCKAGKGEWPRYPKTDDRPGQDAGAALDTIGAVRTVWWEGEPFSKTDKVTGTLEAIETEGRICTVYTIITNGGQRWAGNNIALPEAPA